MKTLRLTDAEHEAVRLAVAQLAGAELHLRTALAKFDRASTRPTPHQADTRRVVSIVTTEQMGTRCLEHVVFEGRAARWTSKLAALAAGAKWRGHKSGRVVVRIDGNEVDPATLGENEALS